MKNKVKLSQPLPQGIIEKDLEMPSYKSKDYFPDNIPWEEREFQIWYVPDFGWCIPTLLIRNPSRRSAIGTAARTYAARIADRKVVRIGCGPHVKDRVTVYVRKSRLEALRPFIALKTAGAEDANKIRDRISTRRAQTALRRGGLSGWF